MSMPAPLQDWTAEMVRSLPDDGRRYEVLDGELVVTPAPRLQHQRVLLALYRHLDGYVRSHSLGEVLLSPADLELSPRRLLQPDLFVVPWRAGTAPTSWREISELLLVVEVISPGTAHVDRRRKRVLYQEARVPEYWIVDDEARLIERWRADDLRPEIATESLTWAPMSGRPPLVLDVSALFAPLPPPSTGSSNPDRGVADGSGAR